MDGVVPQAVAPRTGEPGTGTRNIATSLVFCEALAGLRNQALGLAEAAGLQPQTHDLSARLPWRLAPPALWPTAIARFAAGRLPVPAPDLLIGCGGLAAAVGLAHADAPVGRRARPLVHVQHPRMDPSRFDLILAARHDRLTGANVVVTRTALHRATPARLAEAAALWAPLLRDLPRPLVAVLLGGSNGRFRLDAPVAAELSAQLATMLRRDRVGIAITPSRRTDPLVRRQLAESLLPLGAWIWDMQGENPYFGLLALADAIIVTIDSVSMVSEAVATSAPVMLAALPGRSRRIGAFLDGLRRDGRVRPFAGRCESWPVTPLDDTPMAADAMRRRLGF